MTTLLYALSDLFMLATVGLVFWAMLVLIKAALAYARLTYRLDREYPDWRKRLAGLL